MKRKQLLAGAVIVLALVVNYPLVMQAMHQSAPATSSAENLAEGAPSDEPPAAPAGAEPAGKQPAGFQPVLSALDLADPFLRAAATTTSETSANPGRVLLPQVSLILRSETSRRAVVDHENVGVGDQVSNGVVTAIEADHVMVQTAHGALVRLPLPDARAHRPRPVRATTATPDATEERKEDKR